MMNILNISNCGNHLENITVSAGKFGVGALHAHLHKIFCFNLPMTVIIAFRICFGNEQG